MGNLGKEHFPVPVMLWYMKMQSTSIPMNSRGQGHFSDLSQRSHMCLLSVNIFKDFL